MNRKGGDAIATAYLEEAEAAKSLRRLSTSDNLLSILKRGTIQNLIQTK
jgi:hypothetical protein